MKIQELAIVFLIIILPISIVIAAYTQYQIQTINTETLYDTYDQLFDKVIDNIKNFNADEYSTL